MFVYKTKKSLLDHCVSENLVHKTTFQGFVLCAEHLKYLCCLFHLTMDWQKAIIIKFFFCGVYIHSQSIAWLNVWCFLHYDACFLKCANCSNHCYFWNLRVKREMKFFVERLISLSIESKGLHEMFNKSDFEMFAVACSANNGLTASSG